MPEVTALAKVAASQNKLEGAELEGVAGMAVTRAILYSGNPELIPILGQILTHGPVNVRCSGLRAMATLAHPDHTLALAPIATAQLSHPVPEVRAAAFGLVAVLQSIEMLPHVVRGLEDTDPAVRREAATALANYGDKGLFVAKEYLHKEQTDIVEAAIAAIGQVRTPAAKAILLDYLAPDFEELPRTLRLSEEIPLLESSCQFLLVAIADYQQRLLERVLYILSCLGLAGTVKTIGILLHAPDKRDRANAVETLISLQRPFVQPIMPLLQKLAATAPQRDIEQPKGFHSLLGAIQSRDRWIQIGAMLALAALPDTLLQTADPLVKQVAQSLFRQEIPQKLWLNRLLLLKNVPLLANFSLEELFDLDKVLAREDFLAQETILTEGSFGNHLYIIASGVVRIVKLVNGHQRELAQLGVGQYFGEMSLFDDFPRSATAIAAVNCTLLKLEKNSLIKLIYQRPQMGLVLCKVLSQRIRNYQLPRILTVTSEQ